MKILKTNVECVHRNIDTILIEEGSVSSPFKCTLDRESRLVLECITRVIYLIYILKYKLYKVL